MLINCRTYKDGKILKETCTSEISSDLKLEGAFVWVALLDPSPEEILIYQEQFSLHNLAVEDAIKGHQRSKVEEYGDTLFVVFKTLNSISDYDEQGEIHIFAGTNFILTIRRNSEQTFSNVRKRCESEPHLLTHGAGFVLYALIDEVVDRYFPFVDAIEDELEILENSIFEKTRARKNIEGIFLLKQRLIHLNHVIIPIFDAVSKLHGGRVPKVCMYTQEYFRDVDDHLHRITARLDNIREMTSTAIQVSISVIALNESEDNKRLAAWAALFAIPTMLAGIYGMNFKHMPELEWEYGYYFSIFLMVMADFLIYRAFKKSNWL